VDVTLRKIGNVSILDLKGPLRIGEAEQKLHEQLKSLMDGGEKFLALNLAAVPMVDSSGIREFVQAHKMLREVSGKFILIAPTKIVKHTLKLVGLDRLLAIYDDEASALEISLPPSSPA
jgi:anti-anti-sigma factor